MVHHVHLPNIAAMDRGSDARQMISSDLFITALFVGLQKGLQKMHTFGDRHMSVYMV